MHQQFTRELNQLIHHLRYISDDFTKSAFLADLNFIYVSNINNILADLNQNKNLKVFINSELVYDLSTLFSVLLTLEDDTSVNVSFSFKLL